MTRKPIETPPPCREVFAKLVSGPESGIDLAEAALLIAKEEYLDLEITRYLSFLDAMADECRQRLGRGPATHRVITNLGDYLFKEQGFRGNADDYYDPRNSFLNDVLDRRMGIPITLSTVYMEVGRRLGLCLHGVGMPGHFLVKYVGPGEELVIDPFNGGAILSPVDCQHILDRVSRGKLKFEPRFLSLVSARQILTRMLTNLKLIYFNNQAYGKALAVVDRLLILDPRAAPEIRDRGLLCCQLNCFPEAMVSLEQYIKLAPTAEDAEVIRDHLRAIRQRMVSMN
ncbi:MAG TPA: tetratricopeptide repeat protein [Candidatus Methylomirabilis sp.]|nr:tetratricopeptide repeat protein [Candidatus Methylomirabilis sp.]